MKRRVIVFSLLVTVALACAAILATAIPCAADDVTTASVNGKYNTLLMTVYAPQDQGSYGSYNDWGYSTTSSWAGYTNLPPGYWVYV